MNSIRWNATVSADTDRSVRMFIAAKRGIRKDGLPCFIEEAVRAYLLELSAKQAKAANADVNEVDMTAVVAEAMQWAREH